MTPKAEAERASPPRPGNARPSSAARADGKGASRSASAAGADGKGSSAAAKKSAPAKAKGRAARGGRRTEARQALQLEVAALRGVLDELIVHVGLRLGGELAEIESVLAQDTLGGDEAALPRTAELEALLGRMREVRVKPHKGRVKHVVRIERLIDELHEALLER